MSTTEIPLFPLSSVLFPHGRMPLQIFEQRYLDLVRDCMRRGSGFGVVWIRKGSEVAREGRAHHELSELGTLARIVDWDQLPNGLLGIVIEGEQRLRLHSTRVVANGLVWGEVTLMDPPEPTPLPPQWASLQEILADLGKHAEVRRLGLELQSDDAWEVGYRLAQLLPLEESLKYGLLVADDSGPLLDQLDLIISHISGES